MAKLAVFESNVRDLILSWEKEETIALSEYTQEGFTFNSIDFIDRIVAEEITHCFVPLEKKQLEVYLANLKKEGYQNLPKLIASKPLSLNEIGEILLEVGVLVGEAEKGRNFFNRIQAQTKDWIDNFHPRMKRKKLLVLESVNPIIVAQGFLPDIARQTTASYPLDRFQNEGVEISIEQLRDLDPDVILIALRGQALGKSVRALKTIELSAEYDTWQKLGAFKRGEVFFADGLMHFYRYGTGLIDTIGTLVSALAGFESGYITVRNSFYRMRWVELQRHKLLQEEK